MMLMQAAYWQKSLTCPRRSGPLFHIPRTMVKISSSCLDLEVTYRKPKEGVHCFYLKKAVNADNRKTILLRMNNV